MVGRKSPHVGRFSTETLRKARPKPEGKARLLHKAEEPNGTTQLFGRELIKYLIYLSLICRTIRYSYSLIVIFFTFVWQLYGLFNYNTKKAVRFTLTKILFFTGHQCSWDVIYHKISKVINVNIEIDRIVSNISQFIKIILFCKRVSIILKPFGVRHRIMY